MCRQPIDRRIIIYLSYQTPAGAKVSDKKSRMRRCAVRFACPITPPAARMRIFVYEFVTAAAGRPRSTILPPTAWPRKAGPCATPWRPIWRPPARSFCSDRPAIGRPSGRHSSRLPAGRCHADHRPRIRRDPGHPASLGRGGRGPRARLRLGNDRTGRRQTADGRTSRPSRTEGAARSVFGCRPAAAARFCLSGRSQAGRRSRFARDPLDRRPARFGRLPRRAETAGVWSSFAPAWPPASRCCAARTRWRRLPACRQLLAGAGRSPRITICLSRRTIALAARARSTAHVDWASQVVATLGAGTPDGPLGWLGIDLVLGGDPAGADDLVIEINPRLTTSYLGLRRLAHDNLAAALLAVARGEPARLSFRSEPLQFAPDGCDHRTIGVRHDAAAGVRHRWRKPQGGRRSRVLHQPALSTLAAADRIGRRARCTGCHGPGGRPLGGDHDGRAGRLFCHQGRRGRGDRRGTGPGGRRARRCRSI